MPLVDKIDFLQMQMPENLVQNIRSQKLGDFSGLLIVSWRAFQIGLLRSTQTNYTTRYINNGDFCRGEHF
jgi:hypothetical protein